MNKIATLIIILLVLTGCHANRTYIAPQLEIVDYPPIETVHQSELGDTIVKKGKIYTYDAIELLAQVDCKEMGVGLSLYKGKLKASFEDDKGTYFSTNNFRNDDYMKFISAGIFVPKDETSKPFCMAESHNGTPVIIKSGNISFTKTKIFDQSNPTIQQELIYNGVHGDNIKFLYRELSNDMMRPALTQDIQYDLNESYVIGFKGVRIEIVKATNRYIEYKVLNTFPDSY